MSMRRPLPPAPRILVVRTSAIGDIVFSSPLAAALRRSYPRAHLCWLVEEGLQELIAADPAIDEVLTWQRRQWRELWRARRYGSLLTAIGALRTRLHAHRFDVALDLQGLLKSGVLTRLSSAPVRIGLNSREGSRLLMTEVVSGHGHIERIGSEYQHLARALGLQHEQFVPALHAPAQAQAALPSLMAAHELAPDAYAVIAPFTTRPQKHWFDDAWRDLAQSVRARLGLPVVMLGGPAERARAEALHGHRPDIIDLVGATGLGEAMALISRARVVIGVDTGLTHMGIGFGRPTVALFGSTRPYLDTGRENARVIWLGLACSPCRRHPTCAGAFTCLRGITPQMVLEEMLQVLER
ncbi:MAG: glycosyltransferase family 9 protein [Burkholderiales bacterium]|nr:glycosyltransferase family 9 protein [Burkholderiales bacterium]